MAQTPEEMEAAMVANMASKTGKALPDWLVVVKASGLEKHGQIVQELKTAHGLGHGYANLVAHYALKPPGGATGGDSLVDAQYAGAKAALRPLYDALVEAVSGFGEDVEISPKKTYVSLRRSKQFALVQPSTRTRVDVGIKLPGEPPAGRLEASGSFNAMVTHRVRLNADASVDEELVRWLQAAYEQA